MIHSSRVFHSKPSILGYPYFWKNLYHVCSYFVPRLLIRPALELQPFKIVSDGCEIDQKLYNLGLYKRYKYAYSLTYYRCFNPSYLCIFGRL